MDGKVNLSIKNEGPAANLKKRSASVAGKQSMLIGGAGRSRLSSDARSISVLLQPKNTVKLENTYKMLPGEERRFTSYKVEYVLKDILESRLEGVKYNAEQCGKLTQELCAAIKEKSKQFQFERYKLVTQVLVGQDTDQSVQIASRCLWNHDTDNFAAATYRNSSIYAIAVVYGMYLD